MPKKIYHAKIVIGEVTFYEFMTFKGVTYLADCTAIDMAMKLHAVFEGVSITKRAEIIEISFRNKFLARYLSLISVLPEEIGNSDLHWLETTIKFQLKKYYITSL